MLAYGWNNFRLRYVRKRGVLFLLLTHTLVETLCWFCMCVRDEVKIVIRVNAVVSISWRSERYTVSESRITVELVCVRRKSVCVWSAFLSTWAYVGSVCTWWSKNRLKYGWLMLFMTRWTIRASVVDFVTLSCKSVHSCNLCILGRNTSACRLCYFII